MPLTPVQVNDLSAAIGAYAFPSTYYDFVAGSPVHAANMAAVEAAIQTMLLSENPTIAKQGLANVLYWGYAQIGFGSTRVNRFLNNVTLAQIAQYQALVAAHGLPSLRQLKAVGMPEYSGISFLSKVLMFLDPTNYCVLDLQLAGMRNALGARSLHGLVVHGTTIGATHHNQSIYDAWRAECAAISNVYFGGVYRTVDVERGFFQLVQAGNLPAAQAIYAAA
ncbi:MULTISPECIES: hypothetical protein [unclassified Pseudomonas]|uniref:hypothetical protein n=1 Tax=unclassified Pseudomonas TaxID=196821 RepID=UPI00257A3010|nr:MULTISPECIES: hypothetical protein [unclassified Pseudomonas]